MVRVNARVRFRSLSHAKMAEPIQMPFGL